MLSTISNYIIPLVMCGILVFGLIKKVNVFDTFLEGSKEGAYTTFQILPAIIAIITAIGMFRASGALDFLVGLLQPLCDFLGFPPELTPLAIIRPISGSGALAVYQDILAQYGPDSFIGRVASVLQGSTETTFYTIAVYYGAIKISKTRYTVPCALSADLTGFIMSALAVRLFFGS